MKRYELKYTKGEKGVFRMSTVESPATNTTLVMFDNEMELLEFQDDEKQIIYSVAMRPNILIPRKNINGEPAMVFYTEETANDLLMNFFKNGSNIGATVNHDGKVRNDMYIFEAWKVIDPEKDKAFAMGMEVRTGDIVMGQKVDNPEVWQKIKNKELTGFSIEAYLEPILTNNEIQMTNEEFDERVKGVILQMNTEEEEKKKKEDEEKLAMEETPAAEDAPKMTEEEMTSKIQELQTENNDLKAKIATLEAKEVEMSTELIATKQVAIDMQTEIEKGIKPSSVTKSYDEMTNVEKAKFNRGQI